MQARLLNLIENSAEQAAAMAKGIGPRLICATSRDPHAEVRNGRLRADLFYRLYVVPIYMPPLRNRGRDVLEIAEQRLKAFAQAEKRSIIELSPAVEDLFLSYPWPGNVRELLNVLQNAVILHDADRITPDMLPATLKQSFNVEPNSGMRGPQIDGYRGKTLAEIERLVIERTLTETGGSVPKAAHVLDVSPSTLYRKLDAWAKAGSGEARLR